MAEKNGHLPLGAGRVRAARGWRARSERELIKEAPPAPAPARSLNKTLPAPPLFVSVLEIAPDGREDSAVLVKLFEAMRKRSSGVRLLERGELRFEDGTVGARMILSVEPVPGFGATQVHTIRADGRGGRAHLFGNAPASGGKPAVEEITSILKSFA